MNAAAFTLFGLPNNLGQSRLGVTATRKLGGSVQRNRAKRRMREVFRRHREILRPSLDLVVNLRPGADRIRYARIEEDFLKSFRALVRRFS